MYKLHSLLPDPWLTVPVILLLVLSIVVMYSSSPGLALLQLIFALVGMVVFYFVSLINFEPLSRFTILVYLVVIGLIVLTYLIGIETRGSVRWIPLGLFQLQPSELAKPVLVLLLAHFWKQRGTSWLNIGTSLLLVSPLIILVFRQPDLGTTLSLLSIWVFALLAANISTVKALSICLSCLPLVYLASFLLKDYQKDRLLSFLNPSHDPLGTGYNVIQSTIAVGSGELLGRGLGRGTQSRLQFLPEYQTDFVFASFAEEFGLLGSMIVLALYGIILARGLNILSQIGSRFGSVVVLSTLGMIFFQMSVNIGMNIGILPVTGITLPLLSYGGSSLIGTLICLGLVISVFRYQRRSSEIAL